MFQNTLSDLMDCADSIHDELSKEEEKARSRLIRTCIDIIENTGDYKVVSRDIYNEHFSK
jgi:hypothetical protein